MQLAQATCRPQRKTTLKSTGSQSGTACTPVAIKEREEQGYWPGKILQRTDRIKNNITQYVTNREAGGKHQCDLCATIHQLSGTIWPRKAKVLYFAGTAAKSVTIPTRPFLQMTDEDERNLPGKVCKTESHFYVSHAARS